MALVGVVFVELSKGLVFVLQLLQNEASLIDVLDRADNLADLLVVRVFAVDLVFEVLLQSRVVSRDFLDFTLQAGHLTLSFVKYGRHLGKLSALVFFDLLDAVIDLNLTIVELLVLLLEIDETASESLDAHIAILVKVFVISHDLLKEVCVLLEFFKLLLPAVQLQSLFVNALFKFLNSSLVISCSLCQLLESLVFLLALLLILENSLLVNGQRGQDLSLTLNELLLFLV